MGTSGIWRASKRIYRRVLMCRSRGSASPIGGLTRHNSALLFLIGLVAVYGCAPRITAVEPGAGTPGTTINLFMKYLVGWPRVEIAGQTLKWGDLRLLSANPENESIRGEDLAWIEDKILQFRIPDIAPGDYVVTVFDDKGPPDQPLHSALETAAYAAFPPVWPYLFRSNRAETRLVVLRRGGPEPFAE